MILNILNEIKYGTLTLVVQDGKVIQLGVTLGVLMGINKNINSFFYLHILDKYQCLHGFL